MASPKAVPDCQTDATCVWKVDKVGNDVPDVTDDGAGIDSFELSGC